MDKQPKLIEELKKHVESLAEKVHDAWQEEKTNQGFHAPINCPSENKHSYSIADQNAKNRFDDHFDYKFYKWCDKCHADLYPYQELPENIKDYDRATVKTVLNAIKDISPIPPTIKQGDSVKLPSGEIDTIIDIQYVHDRYQTRNVSGWMYGIKDLEVSHD